MKIAIVGTGISGLVAAHRLHPEHEIVVCEASERIGGHAHTMPVEAAGSRGVSSVTPGHSANCCLREAASARERSSAAASPTV